MDLLKEIPYGLDKINNITNYQIRKYKDLFNKNIKKAEDYDNLLLKSLNNEKYEVYIKNQFKNTNTKIKFICKKCKKTFLSYPFPIIYFKGNQCQLCRNTLNKKEMEEKMKEIYNYNPYEFLSEYKGYNDYLKVKCKTCNKTFSVKFGNLLYPKGESHYCPNCANKKTSELNKKDLNQLIKKLENSYNGICPYEFLSEYKGSDEYIKVKCKYCNDIYHVKVHNLTTAAKRKTGKYGHYCPNCNKMKRSNKTYEERLKEININIVNIESYKGRANKIKHKCLKCGFIWDAFPGNILSEHSGCPHCNNREGNSINEDEIKEFLNSYNINYISRNRKLLPSRKEIDIFIPDKKLAIECDGLWWHCEKYKDSNYHLYKTNECKEYLESDMIHIFENEWKEHKEIIKDKLLVKLNMTDNFLKIPARKTIVREINNNEKKEFLNNNHLQGNDKSIIKLGLYTIFTYDNYEEEKLVAIMTFCKPRKILGQNKNSKYDYELSRYATLLNTLVIGGFSKLLTYFEKHYEWNKIITYADKRYSNGNLYIKNNFIHLHDSKPNYFYYNRNQQKLYHRYNFRKSKLKELFPDIYSDNKTEKEIMKETKIYFRIYDCGSMVFEYTNRYNKN